MRCEDRKNNDILLEVRNLKVHIKLDEGILKAVDGVSFPIKRGKTMGLVGESGCGKSLTSKAIISINPDICQTTGEVLFYDSEKNEIINLLELEKDSAEIRDIRGKKISMIFQEPMTAFSPLHTIGNQIMENILIHKMKNKKEAKEVAINMLKRVGIADAEKRINQYPHEFSGGMRQRAMIAMALSCNPELLIADEPTTALDVTIQAQVLDLMKDLKEKYSMSIIIITHDLGVIAEMCDRVAVMYAGNIIEYTDVTTLFSNPKHPYTLGLLKSLPRTDKEVKRLQTIPGNVPSSYNFPKGCKFHNRCPLRDERCLKEEPVIKEIEKNHKVRCWNYKKINKSKITA